MKYKIFKDLTVTDRYWVKFEYKYYPIKTYESAKSMAGALVGGDTGYGGGNYTSPHSRNSMSDLKEIL